MGKMMEHGGKTVFGASIGILMLETRFPRIPGDMGNAATWPFPVQYRVVKGATPDIVVRGDPRQQLDAFITAGRDLVEMGCDGITTTCGFLSLLQEDLKEALDVPVATSSLIQVPLIERLLPAKRHVTVVTISKATLTEAHLAAAGARLDTPIIGTDSGQAFSESVLNDKADINFEACRQDLIAAGNEVRESYPETGAIVLECTNMVPFAADIRKATGMPVYSIRSLITWFQSGLLPQKFSLELDDPRH
jgi:Asp/Glu/hydantoin racemase